MTEFVTGIIADIGGTNARFAMTTADGGWRDEMVLKCADYTGPAEAARHYLAYIDCPTPQVGAFCVACPVLSDRVQLTNNQWDFSVEKTRAALSLKRLEIVNDFVANALACPWVGPKDLVQVDGGEKRHGFPIVALGPGTGLGVALMVPMNGTWVPIAGEGGHVTLPAATRRESEVILRLIEEEHGHVSAERLVSGPGLTLLHRSLCRIDGRRSAVLSPAEITHRAVAGTDPYCSETLNMMCAFLGTIAGNAALTAGTLGGVYIMGGIIPRILDFFKASPFRERFEAKGRFRTYLAEIPTCVVTHPYPAFLGLRGLVSE